MRGASTGIRCGSWRAEVGMKNSWGVAKLVKAPDFDSGMRRFESFLPSPPAEIEPTTRASRSKLRLARKKGPKRLVALGRIDMRLGTTWRSIG